MHGGPIKLYNMPEMWTQLKESSSLVERRAAVDAFNAESMWKKRGLSMVPMKYGLTKAFAVGATAIVSIQAVDAWIGGFPSVKVQSGGVEMGQGLTTKIADMVSVTLGCPREMIYVSQLDTDMVPNGPVTGGSVGTEHCVEAARKACVELLKRMGHHSTSPPKRSANPMEDGFSQLVKASNGLFCPNVGLKLGHVEAVVAGFVSAVGGKLAAGDADPLGNAWAEASQRPVAKVNLTATGIANPTLGNAVNNPLAADLVSYHSLGAAVAEVEVDVLSGEVIVHRLDMLFDGGHTLNPVIDIGQAEGAYLMGQGLMTQEETIYKNDGSFTSNSSWEYKPPMNAQIPTDFRVEFMKTKGFPNCVKNSKAVGEPPLLLATSVRCAIQEAIRASRVERGLSPSFQYDCPASVDRIQTSCEVSRDHMLKSLTK